MATTNTELQSGVVAVEAPVPHTSELLPLPPLLARGIARLSLNPLDAPAWRSTLSQLISGSGARTGDATGLPASAAAALHKRALLLFPTSGAVVCAAAQDRLASGDAPGAEAILSSHLLECVDVSTFSFYCEFVSSTKLAPAIAAAAAAAASGDAAATALAASTLAGARAAQLAAFEFAVSKVGSLWGSEALWRSYCDFTATLPTDTPYLAGQAKEARRKAYQLAIATPHDEVGALWEEYKDLERKVSQPKLADALIAQFASAHGTAAAVARERASLWRSIDVGALPIGAPTPDDIAGAPDSATAAELHSAAHALGEQVGWWRRVLGYELSNPLHLEPGAHAEAVRTVFRQALAGPLRGCPDAWFDYSVFEGEAGGTGVLANACAALPTSVMLALAAADSHELAGRANAAGECYAELLDALTAVADCGGAFRARAAEAGGGDDAAAPGKSSIGGEGGSSGGGGGGRGGAAAAEASVPADGAEGSELEGVNTEGTGASSEGTAAPKRTPPGQVMFAALDAIASGGGLNEAYAAAGLVPPTSEVSSAPKPTPSKALLLCIVLASPADARDAAAAIPGVYILYQRHARRSGGVDAARAVFAAARRSPHCTPAVFLASARLEYYANGRNVAVARNVLAAGRTRFPKSLELLLSGADFLASVDDAASVRQTLEAALAALPPGPATRPLFDRLIAFELTSAPDGGSLALVAEAEKRRAAAHPALASLDARLIMRLAHRWAVCGPSSEPPSTRADADLLRRHPYAPLAVLVGGGSGAGSGAGVAGGVTGASGAGGTADTPASAVAALIAAAAWPAAPVSSAAKGSKAAVGTAATDGLYLQAPLGLGPCPITSSALSHLPPAALLHDASERLMALVASKGSASGTRAAAGVAAVPSQSAPSTHGGYVEVPSTLRAFLAMLPAFDPAPQPDVDAVIKLLSSGAETRAGAGSKRPRGA